MTIGLLKEPDHETRVSLLPEAVATLTKKNIQVLLETGAGEKSFSADEDYRKQGAQIVSRNEVLQASDVILTINAPALSEKLKSSSILIGIYQPLFNQQVMQQWAAHGYTSFSLDMLPRTTRAQSMDVQRSDGSLRGHAI